MYVSDTKWQSFHFVWVLNKFGSPVNVEEGSILQNCLPNLDGCMNSPDTTCQGMYKGVPTIGDTSELDTELEDDIHFDFQEVCLDFVFWRLQWLCMQTRTPSYYKIELSKWNRIGWSLETALREVDSEFANVVELEIYWILPRSGV